MLDAQRQLLGKLLPIMAAGAWNAGNRTPSEGEARTSMREEYANTVQENVMMILDMLDDAEDEEYGRAREGISSYADN